MANNSKPAKMLNSVKVEKSLQRNILPAIHDKASVLSCRALWSSVEGNSDDICRKRAELDSIVAKVPGVEFFISAITGTSTNCGAQAQVSIRPGIGYLVSFSKNTMACEMGVFNAIHDSGIYATVSQIKTSKLSKDPVLQCLKQVVKDHNSTYATTLVENSLRKFEATSSEILCKTPCCLVVVNEGLNAPLRNAANNLKAVGMLISFSSMWADEEVEIPAEPNTGIGKALQTVRCAMAKVGHALHLGELYSIEEKDCIQSKMKSPIRLCQMQHFIVMTIICSLKLRTSKWNKLIWNYVNKNLITRP